MKKGKGRGTAIMSNGHIDLYHRRGALPFFRDFWGIEKITQESELHSAVWLFTSPDR